MRGARTLPIRPSAAAGTLVLLALGAALLILCTDLGTIRRAISGFDLRYLAPVLAFALVKFVMWFLKWEYYLARIGVRLPRAANALAYLSGFSLSLTPGKVGEFLRSWILQERFGVPAERTVPLTFMERATDGIAMCLIAGLTFWKVESSAVPALIGLTLLFALLALLRRRALVRRVLARLKAVRRLTRAMEVVAEAYESTYAISAPRHTAWGVANGLIVWLAEGTVLYLILRALGSPCGFAAALFVASVAAMAGAVSSIPGGLIANELSAIALLRLLGAEPAIATAATLLARISTLWLGVALGAGAYALSIGAGSRYHAPLTRMMPEAEGKRHDA